MYIITIQLTVKIYSIKQLQKTKLLIQLVRFKFKLLLTVMLHMNYVWRKNNNASKNAGLSFLQIYGI